jgi:arsenate reductase-like glutaredoxin family protein
VTPEELWKIMTLPDGRLRTPITLVGDQVVLGYDPQKLARVLGLSASAG